MNANISSIYFAITDSELLISLGNFPTLNIVKILNERRELPKLKVRRFTSGSHEKVQK